MRRITELSEIIENKFLKYHLKEKDLSNCDLSGLDLSKIPPYIWADAKFENTNLEGTNIKFYPRTQYESNDTLLYSIKNCNFTNCDLSYLEKKDFECFSKVIIEGCNFTGTGLNVNFTELYNIGNKPIYKNVILSKEMQENLAGNVNHRTVDIQTLMKNPNLYISSNYLFNIIKFSLPNVDEILSSSKINMYLERIEEYLKLDKQGILVELYKKISPYLKSSLANLRFFQGFIKNIQFDEIDFGENPYEEIIQNIRFINCNFNNIIMSSKKDDWYHDIYNRFSVFDDCNFNHVHISNISLDSWKTIEESRFSHSPVTIRKNLYVELGRSCNAKCKFCRNQFLCPCKYDFNRIKEQLKIIAPYMNSIVLGGGEPTLNMNDLISAIDIIRNSFATPYIFTNGTMPYLFIYALYKKCRFNVSRHHYDSKKNASIFGLPMEQIWDDDKLSDIVMKRDVTMCATCFQGGLDTPDELIEYIKYVSELDGERILFQTLHEDLKNSNKNQIKPIETNVFEEVIELLESQGFKKSQPIYSTGDYKLLLLSKGRMNISFKQYITEQELQKEWNGAVKRTFDLSMDPSGEIYQNWHQSCGKVDTKQLINKL